MHQGNSESRSELILYDWLDDYNVKVHDKVIMLVVYTNRFAWFNKRKTSLVAIVTPIKTHTLFSDNINIG